MALERKPSGAYDAAFPITLPNEQVAYAPVAVATDDAGRPAVTRENVALVTNGTNNGPQAAYGGDYYIRARATNWNGASVRIQYQDVDGATYVNLQNQDGSDVAAFTANRTQPAGLAGTSLIQAVVTGGPPTGLYVVAQRVPA